MRNNNEIIVLHEYGANNHYHGLVKYCRNNRVEISFFEFRFVYQFLKGLYRRDFSLVKRSFVNFRFLLGLFLGLNGNKRLIVGIAPYDWRVIFFAYLSSFNRCYLHTSWPFWVKNFQPKKNNALSEYFWKFFVGNICGVFAVTKSVKNGFLEKYSGFDSSNISVVYHSIDESFLDSVSLKENHGPLRVVYVGRFDESKGLNKLISLASMLPDIEFHFIGQGRLGSELVGGNVFNHGLIKERNKLAEKLCEYDVLLLPCVKTETWQELFGMVIIEALCCGLYPIVSNHLGPSEVIQVTDGTLIQESDYEKDVCELLSNARNGLKLSLEEKLRLHELSLTFAESEISKRWGGLLSEV